MADTKYLQRRGSCWYVRVPSPPRAWGKGGEFVASLRTSDLRTAQRLRDKYLLPLLAETSAAGMVTAIGRLASAASEAVSRQLAELRGDLSRCVAEPLSFRALGDRFLVYLGSSRAYAPASLSKYATSVDAYCRLAGEDTNPDELTTPDVAGFRDQLLSLPSSWQQRSGSPTPAGPNERHLSSRTVNRILMDLRRMFRWAISEAVLARRDNPFEGVSVARVAVNHKRAPSPEEAAGLMALPRPRAIDELTWRIMPVFARYTGCRAGELSQLRGADVVTRLDVRCLQITAHGEGRQLKTASSERLVPVADKLAPHLDALLAVRRDGTLMRAGDYRGHDGTVKHAHSFLRHYNRRAKKVADDLCFHCWRVYANDAMATAGVDIGDRERLLGHKSGRTQAAYTPENLKRLKAAVDAIP